MLLFDLDDNIRNTLVVHVRGDKKNNLVHYVITPSYGRRENVMEKSSLTFAGAAFSRILSYMDLGESAQVMPVKASSSRMAGTTSF